MGKLGFRLTLNLSGSRTFREITREGAAILEDTVQDSVFPHENIEKSCGFVVNSSITKGVLFGFRQGILMNLANAVNCVPLFIF